MAYWSLQMTISGLENPPTKNKKLLEWVEEVATLTQPDKVEWCDGSDAEWERLDDWLDALSPSSSPSSPSEVNHA